MWRKLKKIILLLPVFVMIFLIGFHFYEKNKIDKQLSEANNLVWGSGHEKITFHVQKISSGELDTYEISLIKNNKPLNGKDIYIFNKDMFGGGFIKAIQADDDQELEVFIWGVAEEDISHLLDHSEGAITKIGFKKLPYEIREIAMQWRQVYITNPMVIFLSGIFFFSCYVLIGIILFIIKMIKYFKTRTEYKK